MTNTTRITDAMVMSVLFIPGLGRRLGPASASGYSSATERLGLVVSQVKLSDALPRIGKGNTDNGSLSLRYLLAGLVTDTNRLSCHCLSLRVRRSYTKGLLREKPSDVVPRAFSHLQ
jgi:hypothetical protein